MKAVTASSRGPVVGVLVDDLVEWIASGLQPTGIQRVMSEILASTSSRPHIFVPVATIANHWRLTLRGVEAAELVWPSEVRGVTTTTRGPVFRAAKRAIPQPMRAALRLGQRALRRTWMAARPVGHGIDVEVLLVIGSFWAGPTADRIRELAARGVHVRTLVYDTIPLERPDWFDAGYPERFLSGFLDVIPISETVVTLSHEVSERLVERFGVLRGHVRVATPTLSASRPRLPVPEVEPSQTLLAPGTVEPRKNHRLILDAWAIAAADPRLKNARLVICGRRGWRSESIEEEILREGERLRIDRVDAASDSDLERIYASCHATVHASVSEGLGLPPRESIARGIPTLMSSAIPRDGLPAGSFVLFDLEDPAKLAELIIETLSAPHMRRAVQLPPGTGWEPVMNALLGD